MESKYKVLRAFLLSDWNNSEYPLDNQKEYYKVLLTLSNTEKSVLQVLTVGSHSLSLLKKRRDIEIQFKQPFLNGTPSTSYPFHQVQAIDDQIKGMIANYLDRDKMRAMKDRLVEIADDINNYEDCDVIQDTRNEMYKTIASEGMRVFRQNAIALINACAYRVGMKDKRVAEMVELSKEIK